MTVTGLAEPEQIDAVGMTHQTLPVLRVQPVIGRGFSSKDDDVGSPETVILSHAYWQRRFGGDPTAVGRRLILDGKARDIIGVLPQNFQFLTLNPAVILPLQFKRAEVFFGNFSFQALARLKPGVTIQQANADVARMIPMMFEKFPMPPGMNMEMVKQVRLGPNLHSLKEDVGRRRGNCALGSARDRWHRAADCLRQCREPAAGARRRAPAGTGDSRSPWRRLGQAGAGTSA